MHQKILEALDCPWKVRTEIRRILLAPFVRVLMRWHGVRWQHGWKLYGMPVVQRRRFSTIEIGENADLRSWMRSNPLAPHHPVVLSTRQAASRITIGRGFAMTGGVLCADTLIEIGDRVSIGANCLIVDTDFHPLRASDRDLNPNAGASAPVRIEDDVFIGANSVVLKGVTIGRGSVIGAGSVVARSVPPGSIAAGNPARVLRSVEPERVASLCES